MPFEPRTPWVIIKKELLPVRGARDPNSIEPEEIEACVRAPIALWHAFRAPHAVGCAGAAGSVGRGK